MIDVRAVDIKAVDMKAIDIKAMESELNWARQAKLDALAAGSDVEDMIVEVQHLDSRPPRLAFFISGFDDDVDPVTN